MKPEAESLWICAYCVFVKVSLTKSTLHIMRQQSHVCEYLTYTHYKTLICIPYSTTLHESVISGGRWLLHAVKSMWLQCPCDCCTRQTASLDHPKKAFDISVTWIQYTYSHQCCVYIPCYMDTVLYSHQCCVYMQFLDHAMCLQALPWLHNSLFCGERAQGLCVTKQ